MVLCGDFNNAPESPIYAYMARSFLQHKDLQPLEQEPFRSAYAAYQQNAKAHGMETEPSRHQNEPPHTTVNYRRCWTIDYVWYTPQWLVPRQVLVIPSERVLRAEDGPLEWRERVAKEAETDVNGNGSAQRNRNGIPNSKFGSDHVPLLAHIEFLE